MKSKSAPDSLYTSALPLPWKLQKTQHEETYSGIHSVISEIPLIGHCRFADAMPVGALVPHSHPSLCELHVVKRGELGFNALGLDHLVGPDQLFFTAPGVPHGHLNETIQPGQWYRIQFRLPVAPAPRELIRLARELTAMKARSFPASPQLVHSLGRMLKEHREKSPFSASLLRALLTDLLICLRRDASPSGLNLKPAMNPNRMKRAIQWIDEHLGDSFSVGELATHLRLSPSRFRTWFLQETGYTPIQFIAHRRIDLAKVQLLKTQRSCTDIGLNLGFCSSAHFASTFRRHSGLSPHAFREKSKGES